MTKRKARGPNKNRRDIDVERFAPLVTEFLRELKSDHGWRMAEAMLWNARRVETKRELWADKLKARDNDE